ncbi:hypothetical protein GRF29_154g1317643 [Pseudopithomyces chartarum]|uniref:Uncharacterized protein n=1 Tax=Pseudopithomyces chartarum TaxID=1892770 RepID=A0AAN6LTR6_9PLEO|nr:hypothetical protein GRF29_154g1317643 [Pseudopithomyces chartarum]
MTMKGKTGLAPPRSTFSADLPQAVDHVTTVEQLVAKIFRLEAENRGLKEQEVEQFNQVFELTCCLTETQHRVAKEKDRLEKEIEGLKKEKGKLLKFQKQVQDAVHGYNR